MSVSIAHDTWKGRGGRFLSDGSVELEGALDVYTTSTSDDALVVKNALEVSIYAQYPGEPYAFLDHIDCRNSDQHPLIWNVLLRYTTRPRRQCAPQDLNPLAEPAIITWPTYHEEEIVYKATRIDNADEFGEGDELPNQHILNSAGQPFQEPLFEDVTRKGIVITRNEATYDPEAANDWELTVNSEPFAVGGKIITAKKARIWEITAEPRVVGSADVCFHFWRVTYVIHLKKNGWRRFINDVGTTEVLRADGTGGGGANIGKGFAIGYEVFSPVPIKDTDGHPIAVPVPLDGNGKRAEINDDPKYVVYKTKEERDFNLLNLPQNADGT